MNIKKVIQILGHVLLYMACLMILPIFVGIIYGEYIELSVFIIPIVIMLVLSFLMMRFKTDDTRYFSREGFATVGLTWILISLFGSIPFVLHGFSFFDSFFECVSGFTTTGATILTEIESLPKCLVFWRSLTNWIGGMGILIFTLAIIPKTGISSIYLVAAESTGPTAEKMSPKLRDCAKISYGLYIGFTIIEIILLRLGGMTWYESIINTFGTVSTGGFSNFNAGLIGTVSPYCEIVITVFMVLCGINFQLFYFLLIKHSLRAFRNSELLAYLGIIFFSVAAISASIHHIYGNIADSIRYAVFQVASIMTTTGFSTADYDLWPTFAKTILFLLMFVGGCAGSTAGGIKVTRFIIIAKNIYRELCKLVSPRSVKSIRVDGNKTVDDAVVNRTTVFVSLYFLIFGASLLILSFDQMDLYTNISAVASGLNNIGPGFHMVGPTMNFSAYSDLSKLVLSFDMLLGRLELYPILVLFFPKTWKK